MSGEVSSPFGAGEVASGDCACTSFPGGERGRPGEAVAVVVGDKQVLAAGVERGGGSGALFGVERGAFLGKRGAGPQLDRSVLATGGREPLTSGVEGDAGGRAGGHGHGACDL